MLGRKNKNRGNIESFNDNPSCSKSKNQSHNKCLFLCFKNSTVKLFKLIPVIFENVMIRDRQLNKDFLEGG